QVLRDLQRDVRADRVEGAVGEVHHPAHAEDQRQAQRDQQVVTAEDEAVDHLLQQEKQLHQTKLLAAPLTACRCSAPWAARAAPAADRARERRRRTSGSPTCPSPGPWASP